MKYSKSFITELIIKIKKKLLKIYTYDKDKVYIYLTRNVGRENIHFTFAPFLGGNLDIVETLNLTDDNTIIKMAIDLGIEIPNIVYSVVKIETKVFNDYKRAKRTFDKVLINVLMILLHL